MQVYQEHIETWRAKNIDIKYHHIRDGVKRGEVTVEYCETNTTLVDIMTNVMPRKHHKDLTTALLVLAHVCIEGVC